MAKTFQATFWYRILNSINTALLGVGITMGKMTLLEVRGRKSGQLHTTPVMLFNEHGHRWLCSSYGQVNWVRNLRAAGEATLRRGRHTERIYAVELDAREAAPLLKRTLASLPRYMLPYFDVTADSPLEECEREVRAHPVFLVHAAGSHGLQHASLPLQETKA
jgi:deazaflavin-dependent oxidoreductase (nitroreductase family)